MQNACRIFSGLGPQPLYNLYTVNGRCQSLLQSTRMGSHPLLMVDVKVKSTTVNEYGFTPFASGGCQVYYSKQEWVYTLC